MAWSSLISSKEVGVMYFEDFNYGNNIKSKYIDFPLDINLELYKQSSLLKEDLIQIHYTNGYILDVGYYPKFDFKNGLFKIVVSKKRYDNKIISYSANDINTLIKNINLAIQVIQDTFQDIYTYEYFRQNCSRNQWGLVRIQIEKSTNGFQLLNKSSLDDKTFQYVYKQMSISEIDNGIDLSTIKATILYAEYHTKWGSFIELPLFMAIYEALKNYLDK